LPEHFASGGGAPREWCWRATSQLALEHLGFPT